MAIVVDDASRHAPSAMMILPVLAELNAAGVKDENVTVIFGCGTHRPVKPEEASRLLGRRSSQTGEKRLATTAKPKTWSKWAQPRRMETRSI